MDCGVESVEYRSQDKIRCEAVIDNHLRSLHELTVPTSVLTAISW